ncbi:hypothetical protein EON63_03040 [archaeon]|nr:MAG: hypothetical protein EON63_03040 [archaeon]
MASWPADHSWKIHKINLKEIWLIDIFGGGEHVVLCIHNMFANFLLMFSFDRGHPGVLRCRHGPAHTHHLIFPKTCKHLHSFWTLAHMHVLCLIHT